MLRSLFVSMPRGHAAALKETFLQLTTGSQRRRQDLSQIRTMSPFLGIKYRKRILEKRLSNVRTLLDLGYLLHPSHPRKISHFAKVLAKDPVVHHGFSTL